MTDKERTKEQEVDASSSLPKDPVLSQEDDIEKNKKDNSSSPCDSDDDNLSKTSDTSSARLPQLRRNDFSCSTEDDERTQPGAYSVNFNGRPARDARSIESEEEDDDDDDNDDETIAACVEPELIRHVNQYDVRAEAYVVHEDEDNDDNADNDESGTAAEPSLLVVASPMKKINKRLLVAIVAGVSVVALGAVALGVGLTVGGNGAGNDTVILSELGRLEARVWMSDPEMEINRFSRVIDGEEVVTTRGFSSASFCQVKACRQEGAGCLFSVSEHYNYGCCTGDDCVESERCFRSCPPDACVRKENCESTLPSDCYDCHTGPNGEELYIFDSAVRQYDCLSTGYKRADNGELYKWAIVCGPPFPSSGPFSRDPGWSLYYHCRAFRQGAGITSTISEVAYCPYIQAATCGCGPTGPDYSLYGLPTPDRPCLTSADCPYLCADAGAEEVKKLCYDYKGIETVEGENAFNADFFNLPKHEGSIIPIHQGDVEIEIYDEEPPAT